MVWILCFYQVNHTKLITLPKKPNHQVGRKSAEATWPCPQHWLKIRILEYEKPKKKLTLSNPADKLEENLDKNMIKNYNWIDDRMELKIIPFKYGRKNK